MPTSNTERDARLRMYAEMGDSRQYLGPQEDRHAASTLLRADVASLLKERDEARQTNARLNRRVQENEAAAVRLAKIEERLAERASTRKPLPRIEAAFALAAARVDLHDIKDAYDALQADYAAAVRALRAAAANHFFDEERDACVNCGCWLDEEHTADCEIGPVLSSPRAVQVLKEVE